MQAGKLQLDKGRVSSIQAWTAKGHAMATRMQRNALLVLTEILSSWQEELACI